MTTARDWSSIYNANMFHSTAGKECLFKCPSRIAILAPQQRIFGASSVAH